MKNISHNGGGNMASEKKKNKLKNSYCVKGMLKNKDLKLKRTAFFTSSQRKENNSFDVKD